jgi:NAD(P)-dependent dehydrogenase (short-subunit alcohol dehydrogenase family)
MPNASPRGTRVWLITGTSSGFGRAIAQAALDAGDRIVATARRTEDLDDLVAYAPGRVTTFPLDITDIEAISTVVQDTVTWLGRIDVLVNNAGRGQVGAVEETTDTELRELFDVHVFGPAALTRAVLPRMRAQGSGSIVQISSFGGQVAWPGFGAYCATKFALEGLSEALAAEVAPHGITVLIVEPGAFRTRFSGSTLKESKAMDAYAEIVGTTRRYIKDIDGVQAGDPAKAATVILAALESDNAPLRLPLGDDAVDGITAHLESIRAELDEWETPARSTAFGPGVEAEA